MKFLDFRHFSIKLKLWLWGVLFMLLMFIIATINITQFRSLGVQSQKLTEKEVSVLETIHQLESLIYQESLLRYQITTAEFSATDMATKQEKFEQLNTQIEQTNNDLRELMKDYAKFQIISKKARWKRLQEEQQKAIDEHLDEITSTLKNRRELASQSISQTDSEQIETRMHLESAIITLEEKLHTHLHQLNVDALDGINSSAKKIHNTQYGARQITLFLFFWFCLIPGIAGYFIIKMISSSTHEAKALAQKLSDGIYGDTITVSRNDELGELQQLLNQISNSPNKAD